MAKKAKAAKRSRKGPGRKGYSAEMKAQVIAAAKKEGLTGAQAAKRFGISTLTFYKWRGPVRGKKRGLGRPKGSKNRSTRAGEKGNGRIAEGVVRREVQMQVEAMLPRILREEVAKALGK